jgi:hypothetical protein
MWPDKKTKTLAPYTMGSAPLGHRKFRLPLFEFNGEYIKDVLERLRTRKAAQRWELCDGVDDEYFKHLDAELKKPKWHPYTRRMTRAWQKRNRTWPDHLRDCEVEQIAWALFHQLLVIEPPAHATPKDHEPEP